MTVYRRAVSYVHRKNLGRARLVRAVSVVARTLEGDAPPSPNGRCQWSVSVLNVSAYRPKCLAQLRRRDAMVRLMFEIKNPRSSMQLWVGS